MVSASSVEAAELPPPPVAPAAWSFSVFGGASWLEDVRTQYEISAPPPGTYYYDLSYDPGFLVGGTIGYSFVDWARTEIEISYANYNGNDVQIDFTEDSGVSRPTLSDENTSSISALTVLGNMWLGFNMLPVIGDPVNQLGSSMGGFSPYFGGGLGVGFVDTEGDDGDPVVDSDSTTAFAWQVGAGIRWNFASNIGLDAGYRFRGITDVGFDNMSDANLYSNNVVVGLVFNF
jgi:opacity protein-like surface antigen